MQACIELLEILGEAEDDVRNSRTAQLKETFDDLRNLLQKELWSPPYLGYHQPLECVKDLE